MFARRKGGGGMRKASVNKTSFTPNSQIHHDHIFELRTRNPASTWSLGEASCLASQDVNATLTSTTHATGSLPPCLASKVAGQSLTLCRLFSQARSLEMERLGGAWGGLEDLCVLFTVIEDLQVFEESLLHCTTWHPFVLSLSPLPRSRVSSRSDSEGDEASIASQTTGCIVTGVTL